METIILAGGKGTRLTEVISDVAKPMAPVNGKPFLTYLFNWMKKYPVDKVILSTGYMSESISGYFGSSYCGIPIEYVVEEKPLGTGGAVGFALQKASGSDVLILNGDTWFPVDLNSFHTFHLEHDSMFSVALKRMQNFSRYGSVESEGDRITKFNEKKFCSDGLVNGGIYLINKQFFGSFGLPEVFSLELDLLEKLAGSSTLKGRVFDDVFIDIGVPEDYYKAREILKIL